MNRESKRWRAARAYSGHANERLCGEVVDCVMSRWGDGCREVVEADRWS